MKTIEATVEETCFMTRTKTLQVKVDDDFNAEQIAQAVRLAAAKAFDAKADWTSVNRDMRVRFDVPVK